MYYTWMVQPKKPPTSIRPGDERLARIDAYAAEHKLSRHLAILLMLDEGYRSLTAPKVVEAKPAPRPKFPPSAAVVVKAARPVKAVSGVDIPVFQRKAFNPQPKTGKTKR